MLIAGCVLVIGANSLVLFLIGHHLAPSIGARPAISAATGPLRQPLGWPLILLGTALCAGRSGPLVGLTSVLGEFGLLHQYSWLIMLHELGRC